MIIIRAIAAINTNTQPLGNIGPGRRRCGPEGWGDGREGGMKNPQALVQSSASGCSGRCSLDYQKPQELTMVDPTVTGVVRSARNEGVLPPIFFPRTTH